MDSRLRPNQKGNRIYVMGNEWQPRTTVVGRWDVCLFSLANQQSVLKCINTEQDNNCYNNREEGVGQRQPGIKLWLGRWVVGGCGRPESRRKRNLYSCATFGFTRLNTRRAQLWTRSHSNAGSLIRNVNWETVDQLFFLVNAITFCSRSFKEVFR